MITADQINQLFSFLSAGPIGEVTFWLRFISGIITSALAAAVLVVLIKFRQLIMGGSAPPAPASAEVPDAVSPWQEIMRQIDSSSPADWNLAVIRADSTVDGVLKGMGLSGATMGDRLKQMDRSRLAALDGLWEAHKIRNRIVHDTDQVLTYAEAKRAVMLYGEALRELGYVQE